MAKALKINAGDSGGGDTLRAIKKGIILAGRIVEGATIAEVGAVAAQESRQDRLPDEPSRAELLGHDELFCITRI